MPTVLLVDDSPAILKEVQSMLLHHPDIEVVGAVLTLAEAIRVNYEMRPAVTVLDLDMAEGYLAKHQAEELVRNSETVVLMDLRRVHNLNALASTIGVASCIGSLKYDPQVQTLVREAVAG